MAGLYPVDVLSYTPLMPQPSPFTKPLALLLLAACAPAEAEPPLFHEGLRPLDLDPPPGLSLSAQDCARCHPRVAKEWRASGHAGAFSDVDFQASWQESWEGWCVQCHLPLKAAQEEAGGRATQAGGALRGAAPVAGGLSEEGVSCAACHVRGGEILSPNAPSWKGQRAHPMRQDTRLSEPAFCGGCHQFNFPVRGLTLGDPGWPFAYSDVPLQDTLNEHAQSAAPRCQDCHMPRGRHSFPGAHDRGFVAEALQVQVWAEGAGARARIEAQGVGHAVPTGDPFRALVLELCADPTCETQAGRARLGRRWAATESGWALVADGRVPPPTPEGPGVRELDVEVTAAPVAWRLWMQLADPGLAEALPPERVKLLIQEGSVGPPQERRTPE